MRLATLPRPDGDADGELFVVATDGRRACPARPVASSLRLALEDWPRAGPALATLAAALEGGEVEAMRFDERQALAPLPRSFAWLDGSAFPSHAALMTRLMNLPEDPFASGIPLMYQGLSDRFLPPFADVPFPSEADGIDFEGEFAVVTDAVPMGTAAEAALGHVRLIMIVNDWSLRALAGREMATGFGYVQSKPACSASPLAVTPDELGDGWRDGRIHLRLDVALNGAAFGSPTGGEMGHGFHDLIAHAARTRSLSAGTIIGSGTISNEDHASAGSSCLAERRALETLAHGAPRTTFLSFGDRVGMSARTADGARPFGRMEQRVCRGEGGGVPS